jgi:serine palmitoyltransferase
MSDSLKSASMNGLATKVVPTPLPKKHKSSAQEEDECPLYILISTYLGYLMLTIFGHLRDFFGKIFFPLEFKHLKEHDVNKMSVIIVLNFKGLCSFDQ